MKRLTFLLLIVLLVVTACGGETTVSSVVSNPTAVTVSEPTTASVIDPTAVTVSDPTTAPVNEPAIVATDVPAEPVTWRNLPLRDARTGETFTLADFAGQTVFVHPMAVWCTNCRASQGVIRDSVIGQLDPQQVVFLSLDIETDLTDTALVAYADQNGFPWTFAVATPQILESLIAEFGRTVVTPPSQPHFIISPNGTVTSLMTGSPSAEERITQLQSAMANT
jgi:hypothetical protein